jgi:SAM-dependent methyltransferase
MSNKAADRASSPVSFDRAYYKTQYRNYERQNPARKLAFYRQLVELVVAGVERPRVLDIGCAFGHFLSSLPLHWQRCGMDASDYAIGCASKRAPEIEFGISTPEAYPFEGYFDVITAFDVLEHVAGVSDMFDWIVGHLRPGAGLVFVVPVYDGLAGPVIRVLDKDPTHIHRSSRKFWLLADPRLQLMDWWGILRYLLPGGIYIHAVTHRWRDFCPAIACVMRRR